MRYYVQAPQNAGKTFKMTKRTDFSMKMPQDWLFTVCEKIVRDQQGKFL